MRGRNRFGHLKIMNFSSLPYRFCPRMLSFAVSVFHLKLQNNLCSSSKCTLNFNLRIMKNRSMLHNGKPQTCSAGLSGMAFVYPVKALKDPSLFTFRDSDPVICHTVERMSFPVAYHDPHMTILFCIANCIVCNLSLIHI